MAFDSSHEIEIGCILAASLLSNVVSRPFIPLCEELPSSLISIFYSNFIFSYLPNIDGFFEAPK